MRTAWWWTLGLVVGCQEYTVGPLPSGVEEPDSDSDLPAEPGIAGIEVIPNILDFGYVTEGEQARKRVTVTNVGDVEATVQINGVAGSSAYVWRTSDDEELLVLDPGESRIVQVTFTSTAIEEQGTLRLIDPDGELGRFPVMLQGTGANPLLVGAPNPLDFGVIPVGTSLTRTLQLQNPGNHEVTVTALRSSDPQFVPESFPGVLYIAANDSLAVDVTYTAAANGSRLAELTLESDARLPASPVVLRAEAVDPTEPIALCRADPRRVTALRDSSRFDGTGSNDPNGRPLTYQWRMVSSPQGSAATLSRPNQRVTGAFTPDLVGIYQAELVVTNDLGLSSDPCLAELEATADNGLWVEMFWEHSGDDMDLHVRRNRGQRTSGQDCYYGNCRGYLSWGANGRSDDPILDIDNIPGTGPENINIDAPESTLYTVDVHDYPGSTRTAGNRVTVRIYVNSALVFDDTRNITGEDSWTTFADIDYSNPAAPVVTPR